MIRHLKEEVAHRERALALLNTRLYSARRVVDVARTLPDALLSERVAEYDRGHSVDDAPAEVLYKALHMRDDVIRKALTFVRHAKALRKCWHVAPDFDLALHAFEKIA